MEQNSVLENVTAVYGNTTEVVLNGMDGGKNMSELRPCPFCGGEAIIVHDNWAFCLGCKAESGHFKIREQTIEAWNRRAEDENVKHGRWASHIGYCECNLCHNFFGSYFKYCPNCGALMDGGKENA